MKLRSSKAALSFGAAICVFMMPVVPDMVVAKTTYEQQESTELKTELKQVSYTENVSDIVAKGYVNQEETDMYEGMAVATVDPYLAVFEGADGESEVIGRIYCDGIVQVLEISDEWTKIKSGNVTGYVATTNLCFGDEARIIANEAGDVIVDVIAETTAVYGSLNVGEVVVEAEAGDEYKAVGRCGNLIIIEREGDYVYIDSSDVSVRYPLSYGYTVEEAIAKEEAEEAARIAEEEARRAAEEEERRRLAAEAGGVGITYNEPMSVSDEELWLLACVIDWEANWQPYEGKLAVANVILNRVRSSRYGNSITSVVYAKSQFSGVSDGNGNPSARFQARLDAGPRSADNMKAAKAALSGVNNIGSYTFFRGVHIAEFDRYSSYAIIGSHVFY